MASRTRPCAWPRRRGPAQWWIHGGGGNAWHGFTYDAELDQLYIGTGNGSPWNRKIRSPEGGDNLFLCSIVALNPDTGEYIWHYQTTPGETWDFNSNMDIVLADLQIGGRARKAILHAPKNGFFYVIDRTNGKLISAEPFTETTWAKRHRSGDRPAHRGRRRALRARRGDGGADAAGRPQLAVDVVQPEDRARLLPGDAHHRVVHGRGYRSGELAVHAVARRLSASTASSSPARRGRTAASRSLQAWDPVRQRLAWEVPLDGLFNPGTLTTAGNLVFQGRVDGTFRAYAADTGKELWRLRPWPRHLGAADHLRRERAAVRRDPRRVGRRAGRSRRAALGRARLGVRRADAVARRVLTRRKGHAAEAAAAHVCDPAQGRFQGGSHAGEGGRRGVRALHRAATGLAPWPPAWRRTSAPRPR